MPEDEPKVVSRDRLDEVISGLVQSAQDKLAAAGKKLMSEVQLFHYEADIRIAFRKALSAMPRRATKAPFRKELRRRKNREASRARARNRR
jgi:hypothetical protein